MGAIEYMGGYWYSCDDNTVEFKAQMKIGNQTLLLAAQELKRTKDTIYWNLWLTLANKRRQRIRNEDLLKSTGLNLFVTYKAALQLLDKVELAVQCEYDDYNNQFVVGWADNRRRDAYEKVLTKRGYRFGRYEGHKYLLKTFKKGEINATDR